MPSKDGGTLGLFARKEADSGVGMLKTGHTTALTEREGEGRRAERRRELPIDGVNFCWSELAATQQRGSRDTTLSRWGVEEERENEVPTVCLSVCLSVCLEQGIQPARERTVSAVRVVDLFISSSSRLQSSNWVRLEKRRIICFADSRGSLCLLAWRSK